eukprot:1390169-Amorphochlora_amoeboformis.AAC.1
MPTVVGMRASGISPICPQNSLGRVFMGQKLGPRKLVNGSDRTDICLTFALGYYSTYDYVGYGCERGV